MRDAGQPGEACPFVFNFDPATFKAGDVVSYRVPERFGDFPFVGILVEVGAGHVVISPNDPVNSGVRMLGTRESRPIVAAAEVLSHPGG